MKKMYSQVSLVILFVGLGLSQGFAQMSPITGTKSLKKDLKKVPRVTQLRKTPVLNTPQLFDLQCALLNPLPQTAQLDFVFYNQVGFQSGTNAFGDKQKANFFDISTSPYNLLAGFNTICYVDVPDSSKMIVWRVFDGTSGTPGAQLASYPIALKPFADSLAKGSINTITFPTPVVLPASKKFFISCDFSNLSILVPANEAFSILSSDSTTPYNAAWEQWDDNTWHSYSAANAWDDSAVLAILPIICQDVVTPVSLSSFTGSRLSDMNRIYWTTVSESDNKGFELQRSVDGINFSTMAFIPSKATNGNSNSKLDYEYADLKPFNASNYYRLRQVDKNGKVNFSQVVRLLGLTNKLEFVSIYPNPVKNRLNISLASPKSGSVMFSISNTAGSTVFQTTQTITAGDNNIGLNIQQLPAGYYLIKAVSSDSRTTITQKFVKE